MDQGDCGSCWAFSACGVFGDRIRVASNGRDMQSNDFISQYHLAACVKCRGRNGICRAVCDGHYMDEVMEYFTHHGAYSHQSVKTFTNKPTVYSCAPVPKNTKQKRHKARGFYRVNPYTMGMLKGKDRIDNNMHAIMDEIMRNGPVTATIKVFDTLDASRIKENFYLYSGGVYGYPWRQGDPKEYDGYHAIAIIGWGEDQIAGRTVPYWLIRNSWGKDWGEDGYGKVFRGVNRAIIESDIWATRH